MPGLMSRIEQSLKQNVTDIINHTSAVTTNDIYKENREFYMGYQWVAALDSSTCLLCASLDNQIFEYLPNMEGEGEKMPEQPLHPHCLLGDTNISTCSEISTAFRREYQGEIIVIHTAGKRIIRCTPNHPILSDNGFIRAKDIKNGDNLVCDNGLKTITISKNENNKVASIEDVFSSFRKSSKRISRTVKVSPEDFHGDVTNEEVEIIGANRKLSNKVNSLFFKKSRKKFFIFRVVKYLSDISCLCCFTIFFKRTYTTFTSGMSCFCQCLYLFFCGMFHSFNLLFFGVSHGDIIQFEKLNHASSAIPHFFSDSANSNTGIIKRKNSFFRRNDDISVPINLNESPFKNVIDDVFGNSELSRKILDTCSGLITFDNVIAVNSFIAHTNVYNLETKDNWYIANGIISHNCRCFLVPVLIGDEAATQAGNSYEKWFEKQRPDVKLDVLGPARYKEYLKGTPIKGFIKDDKILTLNELGIKKISTFELLESKEFLNSKVWEEVPNNDSAIREFLTKELKNKNIRFVDFNESAKETIEYIVKLHDGVIKDFSELKDYITEISYTDSLSNNTSAGYHVGLKTIKYNQAIFNSKENLQSFMNLKKNYYISTKLRGQIAHEYGEAINKLLIDKYGEKGVQDFIGNVLRNNVLNQPVEIRGQLKPYSVRTSFNKNTGKNELWQFIPEIVSGHFSAIKPKNPADTNIIELIYEEIKKFNEGII